jgi:sirohydrochlorin cobaltochelatase
MTAFGTRGAARATYDHLDGHLRAAFPGHPLHWAYSSRMVRHLNRRSGAAPVPGPQEVLAELAARGHRWAVLQSTHLLCGHEFHRLLTAARKAPLRISIGLPLLTDPADFDALARILADIATAAAPETATVFVGHGTDHPTWMAYPLLQGLLRQIGARHAHIGVLEGRPGTADVLSALSGTGIRKVRLFPLLLVAGNHFHQDLIGTDPESWQSRLQSAGLVVEAIDQGIGLLPRVADLFCRHVREALDVIPSSRE